MEGMDADKAKQKAKAPCSARNIQKRGNALIASGQQRAGKKARVKPAVLKKPFRHTSRMVDLEMNQKKSLEAEHKQAFKKVCLEAMEIREAKAAGDDTTDFPSVDTLVADANAELGPGVPKVNRTQVYKYLAAGKAGTSPACRGRKSMIPVELTDAAETFAAVSQVMGDEKRRSDLGNHMIAATLCTEH